MTVVRRSLVLSAAALSALSLTACHIGVGTGYSGPSPAVSHELEPGEEVHLANIRQLTFGGENAEAYWSWDDEQLIYQMRGRKDVTADQIFLMDPEGRGETMLSTGGGKTTCSYFLVGDSAIIYSSTRHLGAEPPKPPPHTPGKYTWPIYDYEVYRANADGTGVVRLTNNPGYDAEATVGSHGRIVFTSGRHGDIDVYTMNPDGSDQRRVTKTPGYDGGAYFSPDGKRIVYRAYHPQTPEELKEFRDLLASERVQPLKMHIYVMNADGTGQRQVTNLPGAAWAPYFHPDGKRIVFASNWQDPRGRNFDLYIINDDGTGLKRVTTHGDFDAFPMFSRDGKKLVWSSNRHGAKQGDTNIFVADWVD